MKSNRVLVLLLAVAFALILTVSLASADYYVIKDKKGICKVIEAKGKTSAYKAGPFKTKEEADKAKEKECATGSATKEKKQGVLEKIKEKGKELGEKAKVKGKELEEKVKQKEEKAKEPVK